MAISASARAGTTSAITCARTRPCLLRSKPGCAKRRPRPRRRSERRVPWGPLPPVLRRSSKPTPTVSAFDAGLRMIVGRDHSVAELRRKLGRRGYREAEIDVAEARLMQNGWLGDRRFAERYARRRSRSLGPMAISAELAARGVDREDVDAAIERLGPDTQYLAAHKLADRLAGNTRYASYR